MVTREYINPIHSCYLNILYYILVNKFIIMNISDINIKYDGKHLTFMTDNVENINMINNILKTYENTYFINTISSGENTYYYEISCIKESILNDNMLINHIKNNKNILSDIIASL